MNFAPFEDAQTSGTIGSASESIDATAAFSPRNDYLRTTKSLSYSIIFTLPLFVLYELGSLLLSGGSAYGIRIGADVLIKRALALVGIDSTFWVAILVLIAGGGVILYERRHGLRIRPRYFAVMLAESSIYAVVLGMAIGTLVSQLFGLVVPPLQTGGRGGLAQNLVLSLGAGLYEELVFRLILVSLLYALLRLVPMTKRTRGIIAMCVGALIFSWAHYVGPMGDTFTLSSFVFRAAMGLALNGLYLTRGFGVAAMTHSLYDVMVTLM